MIHIKDDYYIDVDDTCFTVKQNTHKNDKNGAVIYKSLGYYSDLESAIKGFIRFSERNKLQIDCDLFEALKISKEIHAEYNELMRKVLKK